MTVKIITDSTSYIPTDLQKEYNISIVSLNVILNNKSYRETRLDNIEFYKEMEKSNNIPTSSQPSIDELFTLFKDNVERGNEILGIFLSSKMSGTYSSANLVKNMILEEYSHAKIEIIDSESNCMQMGYEVLKAARGAKEGKTMSDIIEEVTRVKKNSRFLFVPNTLEYLKKGGRIGKASALLGKLFQIRPILTVENGETTVFDKVRTTKKAIDVIIEKVIEECESRGIGEVIVHHINCEEEGLKLAQLLEKKLNIKIRIQSIGPVIGIHVGPGCMGVAYYCKN